MRSLVLDASAALKLLRLEEGRDEVRRLLRERRLAGTSTQVPPIFWLEVINTLARRHGYAGSEILEAAYELEQLGLTTVELGRPGLLAVIDVVERFALTAYDAAYLALAEAADADLMTADAQVAAAAGDRAVFVGRGEVAERRSVYRADPDWPAWPGAAAYLRELRSQWHSARMGMPR